MIVATSTSCCLAGQGSVDYGRSDRSVRGDQRREATMAKKSKKDKKKDKKKKGKK
jgi:hypothetical protein